MSEELFYLVTYIAGMLATVWTFWTTPRAMLRGSWFVVIVGTILWPAFTLIALAAILLED